MTSSYTYQDKLDFIANLYCGARAVAAQTGCSWELILSQAALETGWGEKVLPGSNNIFNIKAFGGWKGPSRIYRVPEEINGKKVMVDDPFRLYGSYAESLQDRTKFLKENPRYAKHGLYNADVVGDFEKEALAMKAAGYGTGASYVKQLNDIRNGPSMKRAIKAAQAKGCGPTLPAIEVLLLDGVQAPIANARVSLTREGKSLEVKTNGAGHFNIRIAANSSDIALKVFDADKHEWIDLEPIKVPNPPKDTNLTLIAPTFTIHTSTREHQKPPAKAADKPAPAAPAPAQAAPAAHAAAPGKQAAHASTPAQAQHKVEKGQTLAKIAEKYKVSYKSIAKANGISSPYIIREGQMLLIPKLETEAAAAHPAAEQSGGLMKYLHDVIEKGENAAHAIFQRDEKEHPQTNVMYSAEKKWMVFAEAEFKAGVKTRAGSVNDAHIVEYFTAPGLHHISVHEKPAYCAAFVNWCLAKAGKAGTRSAMAKSFLSWKEGRPTKDNQPAVGAVAVMKFKSGQHHVTFVTGKTPSGNIATLGGNQGNNHEVSHSGCGRKEIVGYFYPKDYPHYEEDYVLPTVKVDSAFMTAASTH